MRNTDVERIELDSIVKPFQSDPALEWIGATRAWNLTDAKGVALTGAGIRVAIIDDGIDYLLPELGGCLGPECKVIGGYNFDNNTADPYTQGGHGTGGAKILAATAPPARIPPP